MFSDKGGRGVETTGYMNLKFYNLIWLIYFSLFLKIFYELCNTILQYTQHSHFYFIILHIKIIYLYNKIIHLHNKIIYSKERERENETVERGGWFL